MKSQISNFKSQGAFTLIEVTIAMSLLALITTVLYGAFYLGHRAVEKWQGHSRESQRLRSVEDFLGGYLRSAYPHRFSPRHPAIFFSGEQDRLTFVSAVSMGMGGRGMSKVGIFWEGEGDGTGSLILEEEIPVRLESQVEGSGYRNSIILYQGVRDFHMDYLDPRIEEERWVEQWDGRERKALPRAVRLSHRGEKGEEIQRVFPVMMSVLAP